MTFVGIHRLQREIAAILDSLCSHLVGKLLEGFLTLAAIVACINADTQTLFTVAVDGIAGQILDRVECVSAAADQKSDILADELCTVAFLIDPIGMRHGVRAHMLQKTLQELLDALFHAARCRLRIGLRRCGSSRRFRRLFRLALRTRLLLLFRTAILLGLLFRFLFLLLFLLRLDLLAGTGNHTGGRCCRSLRTLLRL